MVDYPFPGGKSADPALAIAEAGRRLRPPLVWAFSVWPRARRTTEQFQTASAAAFSMHCPTFQALELWWKQPSKAHPGTAKCFLTGFETDGGPWNASRRFKALELRTLPSLGAVMEAAFQGPPWHRKVFSYRFRNWRWPLKCFQALQSFGASDPSKPRSCDGSSLPRPTLAPQRVFLQVSKLTVAPEMLPGASKLWSFGPFQASELWWKQPSKAHPGTAKGFLTGFETDGGPWNASRRFKALELRTLPSLGAVMEAAFQGPPWHRKVFSYRFRNWRWPLKCFQALQSFGASDPSKPRSCDGGSLPRPTLAPQSVFLQVSKLTVAPEMLPGASKLWSFGPFQASELWWKQPSKAHPGTAKCFLTGFETDGGPWNASRRFKALELRTLPSLGAVMGAALPRPTLAAQSVFLWALKLTDGGLKCSRTLPSWSHALTTTTATTTATATTTTTTNNNNATASAMAFSMQCPTFQALRSSGAVMGAAMPRPTRAPQSAFLRVSKLTGGGLKCSRALPSLELWWRRGRRHLGVSPFISFCGSVKQHETHHKSWAVSIGYSITVGCLISMVGWWWTWTFTLREFNYSHWQWLCW